MYLGRVPRLHTQCVDLFVVLKRSALTVVFTHPRASAHTEVSTVVTSEKSAEQHTARFYVVVTHQLTAHPDPVSITLCRDSRHSDGCARTTLYEAAASVLGWAGGGRRQRAVLSVPSSPWPAVRASWWSRLEANHLPCLLQKILVGVRVGLRLRLRLRLRLGLGLGLGWQLGRLQPLEQREDAADRRGGVLDRLHVRVRVRVRARVSDRRGGTLDRLRVTVRVGVRVRVSGRSP